MNWIILVVTDDSDNTTGDVWLGKQKFPFKTL